MSGAERAGQKRKANDGDKTGEVKPCSSWEIVCGKDFGFYSNSIGDPCKGFNSGCV